MIDSQIAHELVSVYLAKMEPSIYEFGSAAPDHGDKRRLHLTVSRVIEYDFGWVFFYDAKEILDATEPTMMLVGNAPLIVDRNDGQIYVTGTAYPVEYYVDHYRKGIRTPA